jgi:hypothetical protein
VGVELDQYRNVAFSQFSRFEKARLVQMDRGRDFVSAAMVLCIDPWVRLFL